MIERSFLGEGRGDCVWLNERKVERNDIFLLLEKQRSVVVAKQHFRLVGNRSLKCQNRRKRLSVKHIIKSEKFEQV